MSDPTEGFRRELVEEINADPQGRAVLECQYGQVWDTEQLRVEFEVLSFLAPFITVRRLADDERGTMCFQHSPRFYWGFTPSARRY